MSWRTYRFPVWAPAGVLMLLALLWPALWNGFPIVFHDTGGYLARPFEATLSTGRSAIYGAFLALGTEHQFWPNVLAQAGLVAWLVVLLLRLHCIGDGPWLATALVLLLCALTGLPWYTAQLMPDILLPASVMALAMLAFHADGLRRWETAVLAALIAAAIASHMSILALASGLVGLLGLLRALGTRIKLPQPAIALPALAVAAGLLLAPMSNFAISRQLAFTPGGFNFVFGRLVQVGIADRYLADHCPNAQIRLCAYRTELPRTADDWMWAETSPFYRLGGPEQFEPEARRIVIESLTLYPGMHLKAAILDTLQQFSAIATGDGLTPWNWNTQWTFERFAPGALPGYLAGRQATSPFNFGWANLVHIPVQALAIAALPAIILAAASRRIAALAAVLLAALVGNAVICGVLSNPHDRYQSRLAWLVPLVVAIAVLGRDRQFPRSIQARR
ncbi:MAG: hypothetical protein WCG92_18655 [Hyphomicrobiales bacterium]